MGPPLFPRRTIEDTIVDLIQATEALMFDRVVADRIVADLEARWAANRATLVCEIPRESRRADGQDPRR
jgi:hypothetical protein